jgi:hypothetical protein
LLRLGYILGGEMSCGKHKNAWMLSLVANAFCLLPGVPVALAQYSETTGAIQGTLKDPSGAVVSGGTIEASSPAMIGRRVLRTGGDGFYQFSNLPSGEYTLTATAAEFRQQKRTGIQVVVGRRLVIDFAFEIGPVKQTLVVKSAPFLIDTTSSTTEFNLTANEIKNLPKALSSYSLVNLAPGARAEKLQGASTALQGAFQINGASDSENVYAVEGMDSSAIMVGGIGVNPPFDFMQELQVKSGGFSAEYGGALGGVANVVEKRGGNTWHGAGLVHFESDALAGAPRPFQQFNPTIPPQPARRLFSPIEYYYPKSDSWTRTEPGFELGGYLRKDKVWIYGSYIPSLYRQTRTVNFNFQPPSGQTPFVGPRTFQTTDSTHNALGRLDWVPASSLRIGLSWQYAYDRQSGTDVPGPDSRKYNPQDPYSQFNSDSTIDPASFVPTAGHAAPNSTYTLSADWTPTPALVVSGRFGYWYSNSKGFGGPTGTLYYYATSTEGVTALDGSPLPSSVPQGPADFSFLVNNGNVVPNFAVFARQGLNLNADYIFRAHGLHELKVGYSFNRLTNNVYQVGVGASIFIGWGWDYNAYYSTAQGQAFCAQNSRQNLALYGQDVCRGNYGVYWVDDGSEVGDVHSFNHSVYFQDAWRIAPRLTLNLGIRFDKEYMPSYLQASENSSASPPISFGFFDKVAPRLGAAWDVLGNRRLKIYGSWGVYYDVMKYWLPLAAFGGIYAHVCDYTLDTADLTSINPIFGPNGHDCPSAGGTPGQEIEETSYLTPANEPSNNHIVPGLKPMRQHGLDLGAEYALRPDLGLEVRYARKRLDSTIEDTGIYTPQGPDTFIGNPGQGALTNVVSTVCATCPDAPRAVRNYDELEVRLMKNWSGRWFGTATYSYSRLWGNYGGLTNSEEFGRHAPNLTGAFDKPSWSFDSYGNPALGLLPTDRANTFKLYGARSVKWWGMESTFGIIQLAYSGTPLTSFVNVHSSNTPVEGRGNFADVTSDPATGNWVLNGIRQGARTPGFSNTDLLVRQEFRLSKSNEALRASIEVNVSNLWNQYHPLVWVPFVGLGPLTFPNPDPTLAANGVPDMQTLLTGYNYIEVANAERRFLDPRYGLPRVFEDPRALRLLLKISF